MHYERRVAPHDLDAAAIAASLYPATSSAVRVRSDARKDKVKAKETLPSPIWSYLSNNKIDSSRLPAPERSAFSTSAAVTLLLTTQATSCTVAG